MEQTLPPIAQRQQRVQTAVALGQPDRVPFVPTIGNFYALGYDVTIEDCMLDPMKAMGPMEQLLKDYDPDLLCAPNDFFPIQTMELAGATNMRWPGKTHNLPPNTPYQFLDNCFLEDEEWDEYMADPTHFLLTRVLPRRYKALGGLALLNVHTLCSQAPLSLAGAGIPPVREGLENLVKAAQTALKHIDGITALDLRAVELGYPILNNAVVMNPFDEFADCVRGLLNTIMDLKTDPELLEQAVTRWGDISIPAAVERCKMAHAQYAFLPLHCGTDTFMSPDDYDRYYWPPLKRLLTALIQAGVTPFAICEGQYNTRLDTISDIPAGKVIYAFEQVDMKRAKEKLGKVACIAGNFPTANLITGTEQEVVDLTRRLIDECAPGGGYIMSNSISLDNADHRLLRAWHEATLTYGVY